MHYLITGGCGFIGSHLAHQLVASGHHVRVLDDLSTGKADALPKECELIVGDIADSALVRSAMHSCDGVFHLAAIASVPRCTADWLGSHRTNLTGSVTLFEAASRHSATSVPVVYASSAAVYGDNPALPLDENASTLPLTSYGQDKLSSEQYARIGAMAHGLRSIGLRFFNVYGPGQDPRSPYSGVISRFIDAARLQQPVQIYGDGLQSRDFVYVADIVSLLTTSMQHLQHSAGEAIHRVINGASGISTSLLDMLHTIETIIGRKIERIHAESRAGDIRHSLGNGQLAKSLLGFSASTLLSAGLSHTLAQEATHA